MRERGAGRVIVPLVALLLGSGVAPAMASVVPAAAETRPDGSADARPFADDALERIVEAVQKRYSARVVKVTEVMVDGKRAYELRLLSDQRVWTVRVDAETGQELSRTD
jgi:hypothetical protein